MKSLDKQEHLSQVEIDCVIFGYENRQLKILVSKLKFRGDFYSLHSGFIRQDEDIDEAALRILEERTGIKDIYLQEFKVFGKVNGKRKQFLDELISYNYSNDHEFLKSSKPIYDRFTKRCISIGYYALVDIQKVTPKLSNLDEAIQWYAIEEVPNLIMHYNDVQKEALKALKKDVDQKFNAFNLLPEKFTMKEVKSIYETIFNKKYIRSNFQKKILDMDVLDRLEKKYTGAKNKAPYLYRMKKN